MKKSFGRIIFGILLVYTVLGLLWILASDWAIVSVFGDTVALSVTQRIQPFVALGLSLGSLYLLLSWGCQMAASKREEVKEREELSDRIIETAEEGIWVLNEHGETVFANQKLGEMLRCPADEILERPVMDFVDDEWESEAEQSLADRRSGARSNFEFKLRRADDSPLWVLVSATPLYDRDGEYAGAFAMVTDITERKEAQRSLERERHFLADILHNIRDGISILDTDMNIIRANTAMEEWYSHAMPLVGKKCYEAYHGRTSECDTCPTRRALETGQPSSATVPMTGSRGETEGWVYLYAFPFWDTETGELQGVIEYVRDITERKRAEKALRESQRRFTAFMDHVPAAVFIKDAEGRTLYVNQYMREVHREKDWLGMRVEDLFPPEVAESMAEADREALETGHVVREESVPDKQGGERVYETHKFSMTGEDGQQLLGGFALDVTERRRVQDALRASEIRYRTLFETANDAILLMEGDRFLECNERALELYGCTKNQIIGGTPYQQFSPPFQPDGRRSREKAREKIQAALDGRPQSFEWQHQRLDGRQFHAEVSLNRMELEDDVMLQAIVRDVSDRKRARDRLKKSREELRALAARLAETEEAERRRLSRELHDRVGGTISGLSMQLTQLGKKLSPEGNSDLRSQLQEAEDLVQELADQVRDVTSELRPSVLDDYGLIAALEWFTTRFTERTGISATVEGEEPEPRSSTDTETALFRIAQESLTNVAKHSDADRVVISLDQTEDNVQMRIEDNGVGFDEDLLEQESDESGWGLITMRERAYAAQGELAVDSEPGRGTIITVNVAR